ncbi:hypothetical protein HPP92_017709 [Vanilla planifolia]|uniref:F-box protein n=1 Tax=Vanilla planifolia TaxID=51239 RepID=A0A835Q8G5_VANPL|nr:hypothetical protein HPP92_017709 [Vanilla planifolia]
METEINLKKRCYFLTSFVHRTERESRKMVGVDAEAEIERLPVDLLAHIFSLIISFRDLARASEVCKKWRRGVNQSFARKERLSFAGWKVEDSSAARLVHAAYNLRELDISRSCWGCQITDEGLYKISSAKCVSRATSLQHLNIGGTFITDESLFAIGNNCPQLKSIVLWSCRHVTEKGLFGLVHKCCKLESINVWGMRVAVDCFISLLSISPSLQIKPLALNSQNSLPVS